MLLQLYSEKMKWRHTCVNSEFYCGSVNAAQADLSVSGFTSAAAAVSRVRVSGWRTEERTVSSAHTGLSFRSVCADRSELIRSDRWIRGCWRGERWLQGLKWTKSACFCRGSCFPLCEAQQLCDLWPPEDRPAQERVPGAEADQSPEYRHVCCSARVQLQVVFYLRPFTFKKKKNPTFSCSCWWEEQRAVNASSCLFSWSTFNIFIKLKCVCV